MEQSGVCGCEELTGLRGTMLGECWYWPAGSGLSAGLDCGFLSRGTAKPGGNMACESISER